MKIVLDTNVLVSGIFFSGPPYQILEAWRDNKIQIEGRNGVKPKLTTKNFSIVYCLGLTPILALFTLHVSHVRKLSDPNFLQAPEQVYREGKQRFLHL